MMRAVADSKRQGIVIGRFTGYVVRRRGKDLDGRAGVWECWGRPSLDHGDVESRGSLDHCRSGVRAGPDLAGTEIFDECRRTGGVIGMQMRDHQHVYSSNSSAPKIW